MKERFEEARPVNVNRKATHCDERKDTRPSL